MRVRWAAGVQTSEPGRVCSPRKVPWTSASVSIGRFWLVVFNVPSADRTSSKVDKDSLFLCSLSVRGVSG